MSGADQPFVAAFGVDDLVFGRLLGLDPVGVVLGYSRHVAVADLEEGLVPEEPGDVGLHEDVRRTAALETAWSLALTRLLVQVDDLGADGVVGLLPEVRPAGRDDSVSVTLQGTAVRVPGDDGPERSRTRWRTPTGQPFVTTMAGRDLWLLRRGGWTPVAVALGAAVVDPPGRDPDGGDDAEAARVLYGARERAYGRLRAAVSADRADGVVDLRVLGLPPASRRDRVEVVVTGTTVRAVPAEPLAEPDVVVPVPGLPRSGGGR